MFSINRASMDTISKNTDAKIKLGKTNKLVFDTYRLSMLNLVETTKDYFVYDMTHLVNNIDRWIKNLTSENNTKYVRGSIAFLDLGSQNFKYEPSYAHTCVILSERRNTILVVPCSSKKYGKGYPDIIDAGKANGFSKNTGIQSESYRWVHKNRVISIVGKVDNEILNEMDKRILDMIPSYKLEVKKLNANINELETRLDNANKEILNLKSNEYNNEI